MVNTFVLGMVLAISVTFLVICPLIPVLLNVTLITPSSLGAIGSLGYSGCVQPHDPLPER